MAHHHPSIEELKKEFVKVLAILCGFTIITVAAAEIHFIPRSWGFYGVLINLGIGLIIATYKVFKVMSIFMHLKFDNPLLRVFVYIPVFLFFVFVFAMNLLESYDHNSIDRVSKPAIEKTRDGSAFVPLPPPGLHVGEHQEGAHGAQQSAPHGQEHK